MSLAAEPVPPPTMVFVGTTLLDRPYLMPVSKVSKDPVPLTPTSVATEPFVPPTMALQGTALLDPSTPPPLSRPHLPLLLTRLLLLLKQCCRPPRMLSAWFTFVMG